MIYKLPYDETIKKIFIGSYSGVFAVGEFELYASDSRDDILDPKNRIAYVDNRGYDNIKHRSYYNESGYGDIEEYGGGDFAVPTQEGSTLNLTLIKCAEYPNPNADQGEHNFTYSIMAHKGSFKEGGVVNAAQNLNNPMVALPLKAGKGTLPQNYSYISCDSENIVIDTVKKAENGDGAIVRMYDTYNCCREVTVTLPEGVSEVYLCNLMEEREKALKVKDGKVTLPVKNFEIITLNLI